MTTLVGGLLRSLGSVAQSVSRAAPSVVRWAGIGHRTTPPTSPATWTPCLTPVRFRYHSEKIERGPLLRNYDYEDKLFNKGLMPHMVHGMRLPMPLYRPRNAWLKRRALFGQNDYIDILGDSPLRPTDVAYSVPPWLRGFKGNEFQMLLHKRKMFGRTMKCTRPSKYREMNKRITLLYTYLNQKTRDYYWKKA